MYIYLYTQFTCSDKLRFVAPLGFMEHFTIFQLFVLVLQSAAFLLWFPLTTLFTFPAAAGSCFQRR